MSTPIAPTIARPSSSVSSWNSCYSSETLSSLPMPSSGDSNTLPRSSSPWTTRRTPYKGIQSLTSNWSPFMYALSKRASTSSFGCDNRGMIPPLLSETIQPPKASAPSVPQASSPPSWHNSSEWGQIDSDSPRRILGRTISALAEPPTRYPS